MRLLHILGSIDSKGGGVRQALNSIVDGLAQLNVANEVLCLDAADDPEVLAASFKVIALGPAKTSWRYSASLVKWLQVQLPAYDAVIIHGLWQYHSYAIIRALNKLSSGRPRLFIMPHGMLDPYFQKAKNRRIKALRNRIVWEAIEKKLISNADALLFTCETEKILARKSFSSYTPRAERIVGLGVEVPESYTPEMQDAAKAIISNKIAGSYWLFISRIHEKKGVDILIRAYKQFKKEHPVAPVLVIAGPGIETSFGNLILELATGESDIIFTGMLSGINKWGVFYNSELFILPSHQENFGIAVVEAMACKKPVLISNQVNIWREIEDGGGGLVEDDTEEGVLKLMKGWIKLSSEEKDRMGEQALRIYKNNYTVEKAASKILEILKEYGKK